jgi:hypothetical protein
MLTFFHNASPSNCREASIFGVNLNNMKLEIRVGGGGGFLDLRRCFDEILTKKRY